MLLLTETLHFSWFPVTFLVFGFIHFQCSIFNAMIFSFLLVPVFIGSSDALRFYSLDFTVLVLKVYTLSLQFSDAAFLSLKICAVSGETIFLTESSCHFYWLYFCVVNFLHFQPFHFICLIVGALRKSCGVTASKKAGTHSVQTGIFITLLCQKTFAGVQFNQEIVWFYSFKKFGMNPTQTRNLVTLLFPTNFWCESTSNGKSYDLIVSKQIREESSSEGLRDLTLSDFFRTNPVRRGHLITLLVQKIFGTNPESVTHIACHETTLEIRDAHNVPW